jgi:hypothetical protein
MFPLAKGVPAVGCTRIPDQVMRDLVLLPESVVATVIVIELAVTVALPEVKLRGLPDPPILDTVACTVAVGSNTKPAGAFKTIVPVLMSKPAPSSTAGPVKVVKVVPLVSAERLALAAVETETLAEAGLTTNSEMEKTTARNGLIAKVLKWLGIT